MSVCLHKQLTKLIVHNAGIPTPASWLIHSTEDLGKVPNSFPLFAKPVAQGTSKGVTTASHIDRQEQLTDVCHSLLMQFDEPVLVETFLPGGEFTVGLLGTGRQSRVLGTLEISTRMGADAGVYTYRNKENCEQLVEYRLVRAAEEDAVREAEQLALAAWQALECRDAGRIDLRCDVNGKPQFIEANPLAGLHPTHSDLPMLATALGMGYTELISQILESACARAVVA